MSLFSSSALESIELLPISCEARGETLGLGLAGNGIVVPSVEFRTGPSILCRGLALGVALADAPVCFAAIALASLSCSRSFALFLAVESDLGGAVLRHQISRLACMGGAVLQPREDRLPSGKDCRRTWTGGLRGWLRRRGTGGCLVGGLILLGKDFVQPCLDAGDGLRQERPHAPFLACSALTGHGFWNAREDEVVARAIVVTIQGRNKSDQKCSDVLMEGGMLGPGRTCLVGSSQGMVRFVGSLARPGTPVTFTSWMFCVSIVQRAVVSPQGHRGCYGYAWNREVQAVLFRAGETECDRLTRSELCVWCH